MDFFSVLRVSNLREMPCNLQRKKKRKKIKEIKNEQVVTFSNPSVFQWPPCIILSHMIPCVDPFLPLNIISRNFSYRSRVLRVNEFPTNVTSALLKNTTTREFLCTLFKQ